MKICCAHVGVALSRQGRLHPQVVKCDVPRSPSHCLSVLPTKIIGVSTDRPMSTSSLIKKEMSKSMKYYKKKSAKLVTESFDSFQHGLIEDFHTYESVS